MPDITTSAAVHALLQKASLAELQTYLESQALSPGVAYVQTNGNDSTGEIGNPAKPYLTAQAAFNAGARSFELGRGVTAGITYSIEGFFTLVLFAKGRGRDQSVLNLNIQSLDSDFELIIRSDKTVLFEFITLTRGAPAPVTLTAMDCNIGTISSNNTMEGGGATDLVGAITFCNVETDTANADAYNIASLSMIEGAARLQPPS